MTKKFFGVLNSKRRGITSRSKKRSPNRALEETLCFAAAWLGWSRDEIAANVKYEANASYLADDFQLPAIVSLMRENGATGTPLLSRRQLYRLVGVASGGVLDPFEDNEEQLLGESDAL